MIPSPYFSNPYEWYSKITILITALGIFTLYLISVTSLIAINQVSAKCTTDIYLSVTHERFVGKSGAAQYRVLGNLADCTGDAVKGATVTIKGIEDNDRAVITDYYGQFSFRVNLERGEYSIQVVYDGDVSHESSSITKTIVVT